MKTSIILRLIIICDEYSVKEIPKSRSSLSAFTDKFTEGLISRGRLITALLLLCTVVAFERGLESKD